MNGFEKLAKAARKRAATAKPPDLIIVLYIRSSTLPLHEIERVVGRKAPEGTSLGERSPYTGRPRPHSGWALRMHYEECALQIALAHFRASVARRKLRLPIRGAHAKHIESFFNIVVLSTTYTTEIGVPTRELKYWVERVQTVTVEVYPCSDD